MAYGDFTLDELKTKFQLSIIEDESLYATVSPAAISPQLRDWLAENVPLALAIDTEKARSAFIIAPILAEFRKARKNKLSLFSGVEFNVDPQQGLNGTCDFLVSRSSEQLIVTAPILVLVEAKNNRIKDGLAQCIAEMIGARIFNEQKGNVIPVVHGVVTTGSLWRFLKLEGNRVAIDRDEYHIREVERIFGIFLAVSGD